MIYIFSRDKHDTNTDFEIRQTERAENHKDRQYYQVCWSGCLTKNTKWSRWCIIASLNYKNTMINRIIMETVACLRSKCHLKQNVTPSWPWSFWHTSCISDFRCKTKYTNKFDHFVCLYLKTWRVRFLLFPSPIPFKF
jgi:hypothetical protein